MFKNINVYCINLAHRQDKWDLSQKEAQKLGVSLIRFDAIKHRVGHAGCRASHLSLLGKVKDEGEFMIVEDDFKILVDDPVAVVEAAHSQLPADWDMLYLGATLNEPLVRYSDNLFVLKRAWATQAIIYNNQNGVVDYILHNHNTKKFSVYLSAVIQDKFKCFITYPMVATQRAGMSDILRHKVDYAVIEKRYNKYVQG